MNDLSQHKETNRELIHDQGNPLVNAKTTKTAFKENITEKMKGKEEHSSANV